MEAMPEVRVGASEKDRERARRLLKAVIISGGTMYAALNDLYVELKIGGGFIRGRTMTLDIDHVTRHELVAYITALAAVLMESVTRDPAGVRVTVASLEELVFDPEWYAARAIYHRYVAQYRDAAPGHLAMPPHKMILIQFSRRLVDIWKISPELLLADGLVQRYREALGAMHDAIERTLLKELHPE